MIYPVGTDERVNVDNAFAFDDLTLYIVLVTKIVLLLNCANLGPGAATTSGAT